MVHFKFMQLIPYVFLEILTYLLGGYWYLLCEVLSVCASVLAEDFHNVCKNLFLLIFWLFFTLFIIKFCCRLFATSDQLVK